ncbi:MAG: hypothetical protein DI628_00740 [Blastochloris viridis]|uniref:Uncharacterized protein n=1 Tax=Blastochloris viridis TaxID=1079 RepID=A0A6N4R2P4_BLAVI|nr:MAG: hypothetical protein DI628_00740 [Blastochloris viridis]
MNETITSRLAALKANPPVVSVPYAINELDEYERLAQNLVKGHKEGQLTGYYEAESASYCEELGEEAHRLREGGILPCTFSPELLAAVADARTVLQCRDGMKPYNLFQSIHLDAMGLDYSDAFLGEFRAEGHALIVWRLGGVSFTMYHKHDVSAEITFTVEGL